jgi:glycosyltransferase involved in cell wall biosynthesis
MVTVLHTPPIFEMKKAIMAANRYNKMTYVSVSQTNASMWKPYIPNCKVVHNGIDLNKWSYIANNSGEYALWFGRIHPDKGTHFAIAAAKLAGIPIKIAGSVADKHYFETFVKPLLDENAEWVEHCTHEQLNELIGNAAVSVITPCWEEPFGLVVAESLACGTPVAGFARGALPKIVTKETGCLTASCSVTELAKCINDAAQLNRKACRAHAESSLDIQHMVSSYENIFAQVIKKCTDKYVL